MKYICRCNSLTWYIDWGCFRHSRQRLVVSRSPYLQRLSLKVDSIKCHCLCGFINRTELTKTKNKMKLKSWTKINSLRPVDYRNDYFVFLFFRKEQKFKIWTENLHIKLKKIRRLPQGKQSFCQGWSGPRWLDSPRPEPVPSSSSGG